MSRILVVTLLLSLQVVCHAAEPDLKTDWPWWRGPQLDGHSVSEKMTPTSFSERENVIWRTKVFGRGHGSPTLVGERIFLATADDQKQIQGVLCFDRKTGDQLWQTPVHRGGFPERIHKKNTHASATVACNGDLVFTAFFNEGQLKASALTVEGKPVWSKAVGAYQPEKYKFGYGASPLLYSGLVIFAAESDNGSFIVALKQNDGSEVWRIQRREDVSFSSPVIANVSGKDQLLISGLFQVSSFNPETGASFWAVDGTTQATCGTMVWDGDIVAASGGYPKAETIAVRADGSGTVLWTNNKKCYEQSMLAVDGHIYALDDKGIAYCWRLEDGEEMWAKRLGGNVSASPILVGENIYAANEEGTIYIFKANPSRFELVGEAQLGDEIFATPAAVDGRLYYRIASHEDGARQEYLYCIGTK